MHVVLANQLGFFDESSKVKLIYLITLQDVQQISVIYKYACLETLPFVGWNPYRSHCC